MFSQAKYPPTKAFGSCSRLLTAQACCEHKKKRSVRALKVCGAGSTLEKVTRHDGENARFVLSMLQFLDVI
jgi:hypothetical protein